MNPLQKYTYNWYPSRAMTAIVPSCDMQSVHPRSLPFVSPATWITWASGTVKTVHRARRDIVLGYISALRRIYAHCAHCKSQTAIEPSSAPPTTNCSFVRSFSTRCKFTTSPCKGTLEVCEHRVLPGRDNSTKDERRSRPSPAIGISSTQA